MNTRKLTEAAMLSSVFVVISIIAISTGVAYSIYLDTVVPILICLIYMRVGMKFSLLSAVTSLLIVVLAVGDIVTGIWMSQGIILGFICAYFISKKQTILDDLFYASVLSVFIVVLVDVYFFKLTGYSFMQEFNSYVAYFPSDPKVIKVSFYIFIATVPVSTVLIVYFSSLFLGNRLNILEGVTKNKYKTIRNYKKLSSYICLSKNAFILGVGYLVLVEVINYSNVKISSVYLENVIYSIRIIALYFVIKDCLGFVNKYIYIKSNSVTILQIVSFGTIFFILTAFREMTIILIFVSILINLNLKLRNKHIELIKNVT